MAQKRSAKKTKDTPAETLDDLLKPLGRGRTRWAVANGIDPKTLYNVAKGITAPTNGTIALIAIGLDIPVARVRAAIEASRAAAEE